MEVGVFLRDVGSLLGVFLFFLLVFTNTRVWMRRCGSYVIVVVDMFFFSFFFIFLYVCVRVYVGLLCIRAFGKLRQDRSFTNECTICYSAQFAN